MKKLVARLMPLFGLLFITAYIRSATVDVVYTDYIRLINSYLPDVFSLKPYLHADVLTRIPINYLERIINVVLFKYSTTFDMMLGALGLAVSAWVIGTYAIEKKLSAAITAVLMLIIFSLDKWEMLTNGTGWVHFWAFACFYYHYLVFDRVRNGRGKKGDDVRLIVLPIVTILLVAGPYSAIYAGALFAVYLIDFAAKYRTKVRPAEIAAIGVPLILFTLSRAFSVEEYSGATSDSLLAVITEDPMLFPKMLFKSFGSMILGGETATELGVHGAVVCVFGLIVILGYAYAIYVNFKSGLYKETAFPMLLILSGLISHGIVLMSRWIFKSSDYMMSSRYALQFQSGILGIVLTFAMAEKKYVKKPLAITFVILVLAGHLCTTGREIRMAKYRKEYSENMRDTALNYKNRTDDDLKLLQYHDTAATRSALKILEENGLNIFRN